MKRDVSHCRSKQPGYRQMYKHMRDLGYEFKVDATGTKRRLMGLARLGYSLSEIGREIGSTQQNLSVLLHKRKHVYRETRDKIAALADELSMTTNTAPYSERTRQHAIECGYPSLWAWDDNDIDNPEATPTGVRR